MTASAPAAGETLPVSLSCRDRFRAARQSVIRDSPLPLDFCRNGFPTRRGVTLRRIFWHHRSVRAPQAFAQIPDTGLQYRTQDSRLNRCPIATCVANARDHATNGPAICCMADYMKIHASRRFMRRGPLRPKSLWNSDNYETL